MASSIVTSMPSFFRVGLLLLASVLVTGLLLVKSPVDAATDPQGAAPSTTQNSTDDNTYCTPSGSWIGPQTDGPAHMPLECMYTAMSGTPSPGKVHGPDSTTEAVQKDIDSAACGDKVLITAGSSLDALTLPAKQCDDAHWITIESTGVSNPAFPPEGTRMTPCWSGMASLANRPAYPCAKPEVLTFKIVTPPPGHGILSAGGDHYRIIGAEITRVPKGGVAIYNLVALGAHGTQSNHIIFDRVWFHGINQDGNFPIRTQAEDTSTTRAIWLGQSNHVAVINSYFSDFYDTASMSANGNTDAQCIGGGVGSVPNSGWGVYKFVNNHCEASGEGILLGGAAGPELSPLGCTIMVNCNLDVPTDIEVRRNYFFKPLSWNGNTTAVAMVGWPAVKNGFEMKIGARALFEANVIENVWYSAQVGYCWSVAPKNQSGGSPSHGTAPTALTNDFTYRYNYCYNAAYGIGVYQSMDRGCTNCEAQGASRVSIHDNLIGDNLNLGKLKSRSAGDAMELYASRDRTGRGLSQLNDINISHNTFVHAIRSLAIFGADAAGQMHNWTLQNNLWTFGDYGVGPVGNGHGCDEHVAWGTNNFYGLLNRCVETWKVDHNAVFDWKIGGSGANWPTNGSGRGNFFYKDPKAVKFTNFNDGNSDFNPANYALLPSSPLHNAASDGRDVGADIGTLVTRIAGVRE